jgi:hypothetical protein
MQKPCRNHAKAMQKPCKQIQKPYKKHTEAIQNPCRNHQKNVQKPCRNHAETLQKTYRIHTETLQKPKGTNFLYPRMLESSRSACFCITSLCIQPLCCLQTLCMYMHRSALLSIYTHMYVHIYIFVYNDAGHAETIRRERSRNLFIQGSSGSAFGHRPPKCPLNTNSTPHSRPLLNTYSPPPPLGGIIPFRPRHLARSRQQGRTGV